MAARWRNMAKLHKITTPNFSALGAITANFKGLAKNLWETHARLKLCYSDISPKEPLEFERSSKFLGPLKGVSKK
jgi:hypothetical protein